MTQLPTQLRQGSPCGLATSQRPSSPGNHLPPYPGRKLLSCPPPKSMGCSGVVVPGLRVYSAPIRGPWNCGDRHGDPGDTDSINSTDSASCPPAQIWVPSTAGPCPLHRHKQQQSCSPSSVSCPPAQTGFTGAKSVCRAPPSRTLATVRYQAVWGNQSPPGTPAEMSHRVISTRQHEQSYTLCPTMVR